MELQNNSQEMKTVVETFVIEETASLIYDNDKLQKWNDMVSELGLTGQTKICKPERSPIPFMHLKQSMVNVFQCLCPRISRVEDYGITPIPVEILELIALSKREGYFDHIQIWYDDKSPDPACIGLKYTTFYSYNKSGSLKTSFTSKEDAISDSINEGYDKEQKYYATNATHYLLGKWADVRHSFEELKEMAKKRFIDSEGNELRKTIKESERKLSDLESSAFDKFN